MFKKVKKNIGAKRLRTEDSQEDEQDQQSSPPQIIEAPPSKRFKKGISTTQLLEEPPSPKTKDYTEDTSKYDSEAKLVGLISNQNK